MMQDAIVTHIKNTYAPEAIILHGSRARGKEREHSDWDFILLYTKPVAITNGRELFADQNIEYSDLKQKLAKAHPDDRQAYADGKAAFISAIIAKAGGGK